jgi:hypothetical protein
MTYLAETKRARINDRLILIFGIPILSIIAFLLLGQDMLAGDSKKALVGILSSLSSTVIMWLGVRNIVVYLWKKHPWEKNPIRHLLIEIVAIVGFTMLAGLLVTLFWYLFDKDSIKIDDLGLNIFFTLTITFFITSLHEGYFFFLQWKKTLVISENLEKENIQSQYETLKSQISPHFLFNNLNTLASLIEEDPKVAVEYVQRTADYYRSILGVKDKDVIPLSEELKLIEDYYFLQKKRYGTNLNLTIEVPVEVMQTVVAPLTIQMLFENAIKHNIISNDKPLKVRISINGDFIEVENNLQTRELDEKSSRIGLQNISNRYKFLSGKDVVVSQNGITFKVNIPILNMQI